jgi:glucan phosphorylase
MDMMVKRLHEYKRSSCSSVLHIRHALPAPASAIRSLDIVPRTFFFGAKSASGYCHRQADHQDDQQRGRSGQRTTRSCATA